MSPFLVVEQNKESQNASFFRVRCSEEVLFLSLEGRTLLKHTNVEAVPTVAGKLRS